MQTKAFTGLVAGYRPKRGLPSPIIAGAAMSLSSVSVIGNALRLRAVNLQSKDERSSIMSNEKTPENEVVYTCPMHPEVQQDKPGNCPKCHMTLEPKK